MLYGSSIALMKSVSLLMLPFIAHHLSPETFGRLEIITTIAVIGSIFVGMGMDHTLFRFAGTAQTREGCNRVAAELFGLTLLIGSIAWLIGWSLAGNAAPLIPGHPSTYEIQLVISVLALEGCIAIPLAWLRMQNRAYTFFLLTTGRALLQAVLVVVFLEMNRGIAGVLEAGLIAAVLQAIILGYLHLRDVGLGINQQTWTSSLVYSLPLVGSGVVAFALNGMDRWILAEYTTLSDVAQFGVAAKFALAVVLLLQPFGMWWTPRRFKVLNQPNGQTEVVRFISLGVALALIITVLVGLVSPVLITWLFPESYEKAGQYVVGLVLIMLLKELAELLNLGCFTGKTTGTQLAINTAGSIVGILSMFLLTPEHGVWGLILALIIAQSSRLVLFILFSQRYLPLSYPTRALVLLALTSAGWLLLGTQTQTITLQLLITLLATGSILGIAIFMKLIPATKLLPKSI